MVKMLTEKEFDEMDKKGLMLIDFSATWCGPCQMLAPVLEEVSQEYEGKIDFYKVDVDEEDELAGRFSIMNIPALVILENGNKKATQIGFKPKAGLKEFIDSNL